MTTTLTLPAVLAELDAIAKDFGYPADLTCSLLTSRLIAKFGDDSDDNVLAFHLSRENDTEVNDERNRPLA